MACQHCTSCCLMKNYSTVIRRCDWLFSLLTCKDQTPLGTVLIINLHKGFYGRCRLLVISSCRAQSLGGQEAICFMCDAKVSDCCHHSTYPAASWGGVPPVTLQSSIIRSLFGIDLDNSARALRECLALKQYAVPNVL